MHVYPVFGCHVRSGKSYDLGTDFWGGAMPCESGGDGVYVQKNTQELIQNPGVCPGCF